MAIVAFNSSDFCWTQEGETKSEWDDIVASVADEETRATLRSDLFWLRTKDIPRVDQKQLDALGTLLDKAGLDRDPDDDRRLRIAVIHHPIGVVSAREEIKDFEVITNLATVRTFLYHRGFHLVLHGHKHNPYSGWDWLAPPRDDLEEVAPRRALVLGAPASFKIDQRVCRLIEVCPDGAKPVAGAPRLRVVPIDGVEQGEPLKLAFDAPVHSLAQPFVTSTREATPWVVEAKTADAAYQQLQDLRADGGNRAVISVVDDPSSTAELPTNYPKPSALPPLAHMVDWWQNPRPEAIHSFSGSEFNHGERLYFGRDDAIVRAVRALPSSKAIALLVWPEEAGEEGQEFPAFTLVQLQSRLVEGKIFLDVVGVFRKQDLDYWWPVNMAELAKIQERALRAAHGGAGDGLKDAQAGRLIAMTTIGAHENTIPQMAGTALDRAVDLRPEWIYHLAYLAARPGTQTEADWAEALEDIGDREGSGLLIPSVGIERLRAAMQVHVQGGGTSPKFRKLAKTVTNLEKEAKLAERVLRKQDEPDVDDLDARGEELRGRVTEVRKALRAVVKEAAAEAASNDD